MNCSEKGLLMSDKNTAIENLKTVMKSLRDPNSGCPWDIEQNFESIAPYTIEEAYEVVDAIEQNDMDSLKDELGDLLLQVIYHAQMAAEKNLFNFDDVAKAVTDKMISRHPHVFGDEKAKDSDEVDDIWQRQKDKEQNNSGALQGVTKGLPALLRAQKLQKKAAKVNFEWSSTDDAFVKLEEEIDEFKEAKTFDHQEEELGDILFCLVNYARMKGLNSEEALRKANKKFEGRFAGMEKDCIANDIDFRALKLNEMLDLWQKQKG